MEEEIARALEVLRKGGVILYPTDTVWGIGCDATNERAVQRIYELKRSENKKGMLVLMTSADQTVRYVDKAPEVAWQLMEVADKPLTLILPGAVGVAPNLIPEEGTLGVRVPRHAFCEGLLRRLGRPLVSTSANLSGGATPKRFEEIDPAILAGADHVVDPRWEGHPTRQASSIILLGEGGEVKIIRE